MRTIAWAVVVLAGMLGMMSSSRAVEYKLDDPAVKEAVDQGQQAGRDGKVQSLFSGYSFGRLGEVNGYVLTKFFEIRFHAGTAAAEGKQPEPAKIAEILAKDYLQIPVFLNGGSKEEFQQASVLIRQGDKTIAPADTLRDEPIRECDAMMDQCTYYGNIYPNFPEKALDPKAATAIIIKYQGSTYTFEVDFSTIR